MYMCVGMYVFLSSSRSHFSLSLLLSRDALSSLLSLFHLSFFSSPSLSLPSLFSLTLFSLFSLSLLFDLFNFYLAHFFTRYVCFALILLQLELIRLRF
jgi:hypothetical protein